MTRWFALALAAGCGAGTPSTPPAPEVPIAAPAPAMKRAATDHPDVVVIVVDTLRADRLALYGHDRPTSPNIEALAASSTVYESAFSQAPWTKPSIGSLLTSRYPRSMGIDTANGRIPASAELLPELLGAAGYRTLGVVSHSYCATSYGFDQGYDVFDTSNVRGHDEVVSSDVTDRALALAREVPSDEPMFLFVHYFDPHFAYIKHDEYAFATDPSYDGPVRSNHPIKSLRKLTHDASEADVAELLRIYDSEVAFTDAQVGRLLEGLDAMRSLDDAVVVLTADHGDEFLEHGRWGHTTRMFDEVVHVPLVIHRPGAVPARVSEPVGLIDVGPTVLAAAGVSKGEGMVGVDLASGPLDRPIFIETVKGRTVEAVIEGPHKLIWDGKRDVWSLYDRGADPGEAQDRAGEDPETVARLQAAIERWRASVAGATVEEMVPSDEERARLEALGYLGDE